MLFLRWLLVACYWLQLREKGYSRPIGRRQRTKVAGSRKIVSNLFSSGRVDTMRTMPQLNSSQSKTPQTLRQAMAGARLIYLALAGGLVMLSSVAIIINLTMGGSAVPERGVLFLGISATLLTANVIGAVLLRRSTVQKFEPGAIKNEQVVSAAIIFAAMIEGAGLLGAVGFFVTGEWLCLLVPLTAVGVMLVNLPPTGLGRAVEMELAKDSRL
jgi:hypothetical protein